MKTILVDAVYCLIIEDRDSFKLFLEMQEILDKFENKKIVLTGANDEEFVKFNLGEVPYEIFTMKHEPDKVDQRYYETLLEEYNLKPEEVIYFEHDPEAIKSAESVGILSYHYDDDLKDLDSLKKFIDENA